jgi:Fic family protein
MGFDPNTPYNDLPDLPPRVELETRAVLKACIEARARLAELNAEAARLPNPDILIGYSVLLEARDSSAIENIVTTQDALFQHAQLDEATADPATKEALRYRHALYNGFQTLRDRPISTRTATQICRLLKGFDIDIRAVPGATLRNDRTGEIVYTPPVGEELIRRKLANWEQFIHGQTKLDPLVRLAVQHYQFEAVHPFSDGNGRTGRIINILYLVEQNLLAAPILYLSREIFETRTQYYQFLIDVTRNNSWEQWISYILKLIALSATRGRAKVLRYRTLMLHTQDFIRSQEPKLTSHELLDVLFAQPYCRIGSLVEAKVAKRQAASAYLKSLVHLGVLEEIKVGREKIFLHRKLHQLLTTDGDQVTEYARNSPLPARPLFAPSTS